MTLKACVLAGLLAAVFQVPYLAPQPRLILPQKASLHPGMTIPAAAYVFDRDLSKTPLLSRVRADVEVVVLVIFGGAALEIPQKDFRGPLWCQDSFDDLSVQRAAVNEFKEKPVEFIGIAVPPVFSGDRRYGFAPGVFLDLPFSAPEFKEAAESFVRATEALRSGSLLPFDTIYYDPKLLTLGRDPGKGDPSDEEMNWRGAFKPEGDTRRYGAPTVWILNRHGVVMTDPFWGNEYGSSPPIVNYGFVELRTAIESALSAAVGR